MGIWTTNAGNNYKVNIGQDQIYKLRQKVRAFVGLGIIQELKMKIMIHIMKLRANHAEK